MRIPPHRWLPGLPWQEHLYFSQTQDRGKRGLDDSPASKVQTSSLLPENNKLPTWFYSILEGCFHLGHLKHDVQRLCGIIVVPSDHDDAGSSGNGTGSECHLCIFFLLYVCCASFRSFKSFYLESTVGRSGPANQVSSRLASNTLAKISTYPKPKNHFTSVVLTPCPPMR